MVCVGECVYNLCVCTAIGVEVRGLLFGCLLCLLIVHIPGFDVFLCNLYLFVVFNVNWLQFSFLTAMAF